MTLKQTLEARDKARIAVVATGGGAPGICILAGYMKALQMCGLLPRAWSGTSAGAVVGHILSKDMDVDRLITVLEDLPSDAAIKERVGGIATWLLFHDHRYSNANVHELLKAHGPNTWGEVAIDLRMWSTLLMESHGDRNQCDSGSFACPADAALASMSVPYLFPATADLHGNLHQDGGIVFNCPIIPQWFEQYDHVFFLVAQGDGRDKPVNHVPDKVEQGLYLLRTLMHAQVDRAAELVALHDNATILHLDKSDTTDILTFNHGLIWDAQQYASNILLAGAK